MLAQPATRHLVDAALPGSSLRTSCTESHSLKPNDQQSSDRYQGPKFQAALKRVLRQVQIEIVRRSDTAKGFEVLPRRWVVERTIAWLDRCRRLAKDRECLNRTALAFLRLASIRLMLRRLCQSGICSRTDSEASAPWRRRASRR